MASRRAPSSESCSERRGCADAADASQAAAEESLIEKVFEVWELKRKRVLSVTRRKVKRERERTRSALSVRE